jgi:hypothetical protein
VRKKKIRRKAAGYFHLLSTLHIEKRNLVALTKRVPVFLKIPPTPQSTVQNCANSMVCVH